jgi:DNA-binding beta-propeller fold protein YncE
VSRSFRCWPWPLALLGAGALWGSVLWCSAAWGAVTHGFVGELPISAYWSGLTVGPAGREAGVAEKNALFVAGDGVQRFSASGAALAFGCRPVVCGGYVEGNRIKGTPSGEFSGVVSAVVDDETDEIFVSAETAIDVFSASGEYLSQVTEVPVSSGAAVTGPFSTAAGLALDQVTGELYVATEGKVTASDGDVVDVFKVLAGGGTEFASQFGDGVLAANGGLRQTVAVAEGGLGEAGRVYVADTAHDVVDVFGSLGVLEGVWSGVGTSAGSFGTAPPYVGVDPTSGRVYVLDDEHDVVDELGGGAAEEYLGRLTSTSAGPLHEPVSVAVAPGSGRVYVATHEEAEHTAVLDIFGPDIVLPELLTGAASGVSTGGGVVSGVVSSGVGGPVSCWFEWGATEALGSRVPCVGSPVEGENVAVHASLSGLTPDTKYFYRLQGAYVSDEAAVNLSEEATAECEHAKSEDACFTTLGGGVESESVSDVASTSADLNGSVDPNDALTSYFIEYGLTSEYTSRTPLEEAGSEKGSVAVSQHVQGLSPGTMYHYRVVAVNEVSPGVLFDTYGVDESFMTQSSGGPGLLDGRDWEMVSPEGKEGALIQGPGAPWGITQAAADGGAFTYLASGPTEQGVVGYSNAQQILSARGEHGWSTVDLATPHNGVVSGSLESGQEYRFFSEDLSEAILQPFGAFEPCETPEGVRQPCLSEAASEQTAFLRDDATGSYTPLVSRADDTSSPFEPFGQEGVMEGGACSPEKFCGPFFDGATADARHVVLSSDTDVQLTGEPAPTGGLYEWSAEALPALQLQLVSVLPGSGGPETHLASLGTLSELNGAGGDGEDARHAISEDGARVFWTSEHETLYMRDMPRRETIQIGGDELGGRVQGRYQLASADGLRVFYTERGGLFECEIPESLECDPVRLGEAPANRGPVIGASEDGSYIYWVAANDDLYEDHLVEGVWHLRVVAVVSNEDADSPGRVSPNGLWLTFMSDRPLTGYDNSDVVSGEPDDEVYLFSAVSGRLSCVSCDPTGGRPVGVNSQEAGLVDEYNYEGLQGWISGDLLGWVAFEKAHSQVSRYQPRFLSDSGRVFFDSDGGLVPGDVNGSWDVYEYEPVGVGGCGVGVGSGSVVFKPEREVSGVVEGAGCVGLLSSGESSEESVLMDASESGGDVFFMTTARLSPTDTDDSYDVYDAHECPGAVACASSVPVAGGSGCVGLEACRGSSSPPAALGAPLSAVFSGSGNVTPVVPPKVTRAQLFQKALKVCRRDRRKGRRVACERQARKRYGPVAKRAAAKRAVAKRAVAKRAAAKRAAAKRAAAKRAAAKRAAAKRAAARKTDRRGGR